jgi:hypothetical protein
MSKAPKVLGTLSIIFGSLIAAWSPFSLVMGTVMKGMTSMVEALPRQPGMRDPAVDFGAAQAMLDSQQGYLRVTVTVMTLMSVALIVVGVGLIRRRAWARKAALGWSVLGLVILLGQSIAFFAWLQPLSEHVRQAFYDAHNAAPPPGVSAAATGTGAVFSWLIYASFPIVMLALLGRRRAAADFTS